MADRDANTLRTPLAVPLLVDLLPYARCEKLA